MLIGIILCPLPQSSKQDPQNIPGEIVSIIVAFNRPGAESNLTDIEGRPKECKTSVLVTKIRESPTGIITGKS